MTADQAYEMTTTDSGTPVRLLSTERQPKQNCLTLTPKELEWLNEFRKRILTQFPTTVEDIIVHGYRVRGMADEDLWMDVLVVVKDEHPEDREEIKEIALDVSLVNHSYQRVDTMPQSQRTVEGRLKMRPYWQLALEEGISVL